MAVTRKNLGQFALSATTDTDIYTVPASTSTVISSISICNRGGAGTTYRVAHSVGGAAADNKHYVAYDAAIGANETKVLSLGICMAATDKLRAYTAGASVTVNVWGEETT
jgi:hypothetical protein